LQYAGAFVVQFRAGTDFDADRVEGRVEHIASGRTACFESLEDLVAFLGQVLKASSQRTVR
jgi:hypothetical protein